MVRWRRYSGTKLLALAWTGVVAAGAYAVLVRGVVSLPPVLAGRARYVTVALVWALGLVLLLLRDWRHWRAMARGAGFAPQHGGTGLVPLQRSYRLRTVTVTAEGSLLGRAHTEVRVPVNQVDDPVAMSLTHAGSGAEDEGFATGNPAIDAAWVIETNSTRHLKGVLGHDTQSAMMDVTVPGTLRVTNRAVTYRVPFVRLSAAELAQAGELVTTAAESLEGLVQETG